MPPVPTSIPKSFEGMNVFSPRLTDEPNLSGTTATGRRGNRALWLPLGLWSGMKRKKSRIVYVNGDISKVLRKHNAPWV